MSDQPPTTDIVRRIPESRRKTRLITIRVSQSQLDQLTAAAERSDESLATWARSVLLSSAKKQNS